MINKTINISNGKLSVTIEGVTGAWSQAYVHKSGEFRIAKVVGGNSFSLNPSYTSISIDPELLPHTQECLRPYDEGTLTQWAETLEQYFNDAEQGVNEYTPNVVVPPTVNLPS